MKHSRPDSVDFVVGDPFKKEGTQHSNSTHVTYMWLQRLEYPNFNLGHICNQYPNSNKSPISNQYPNSNLYFLGVSL